MTNKEWVLEQIQNETDDVDLILACYCCGNGGWCCGGDDCLSMIKDWLHEEREEQDDENSVQGE